MLIKLVNNLTKFDSYIYVVKTISLRIVIFFFKYTDEKEIALIKFDQP